MNIISEEDKKYAYNRRKFANDISPMLKLHYRKRTFSNKRCIIFLIFFQK